MVRMKHIVLKFPDGTEKTFDSCIKGSEIVSYFRNCDRKIVALKVNNEICPLSHQIEFSSFVEPVFFDSNEGMDVYRRSLCFVLAAAAQNLFPEKRLLVGHSLGHGYYYTFGDGEKISEPEIRSLEEEMRRIVGRNLALYTSRISYTEAVELFKNLHLSQASVQLSYVVHPSVVVNILEDSSFCDMYFGPLVDSTGVLSVFELRPYGDGFLLRFPPSSHPDRLSEFEDNPNIFEVYQAYKMWGRLMNVTSAGSLNELIAKKKINDFIDVCETFQAQHFANVAHSIRARGNVKVVLIAGPSSSGKTTSAFKVALHLRAIGYNPKIINLDSYYVGRELNPRDENGNYDYECLEALDIPLLNQNLVDLFAGKEIDVPSYNFDVGKRFYTGEKMQLMPNDILIMEGIHGLNDKLTPLIPAELKFKIYLSALTQLNLDDHNRISTRDNRLIRRIVRDSNFRGKSAAGTISMWDSVQKGEQLHIFPFQNNADAVINTALDYELPVLKVYASPLLHAVKPYEKEYTEASRLLCFLDNFSSVPSDYLPAQSIIREFIGGSSFKY